MTNNEIIKALEWWLTVANNMDSITLSKKDIFAINDLINRQKAEIERLNNKYKHLEASSLIFKGGVDYFVKEAIKEFAERLKTLLHMPDNMVTRRTVYTDEIDNLVAEMTEQRKEDKS